LIDKLGGFDLEEVSIRDPTDPSGWNQQVYLDALSSTDKKVIGGAALDPASLPPGYTGLLLLPDLDTYLSRRALRDSTIPDKRNQTPAVEAWHNWAAIGNGLPLKLINTSGTLEESVDQILETIAPTTANDGAVDVKYGPTPLSTKREREKVRDVVNGYIDAPFAFTRIPGRPSTQPWYLEQAERLRNVGGRLGQLAGSLSEATGQPFVDTQSFEEEANMLDTIDLLPDVPQELDDESNTIQPAHIQELTKPSTGSTFLAALMPTHGNYVGPSYTGGVYGGEGRYDVPPTDALDTVGQWHDAAMAAGAPSSSPSELHALIDDTFVNLLKVAEPQYSSGRERLLARAIGTYFEKLQPYIRQTNLVPSLPGGDVELSSIEDIRTRYPSGYTEAPWITEYFESKKVQTPKDIPSTKWDDYQTSIGISDYHPLPSIGQDLKQFVSEELAPHSVDPRAFFSSDYWFELRDAPPTELSSTVGKIYEEAHALGWNPGNNDIVARMRDALVKISDDVIVRRSQPLSGIIAFSHGYTDYEGSAVGTVDGHAFTAFENQVVSTWWDNIPNVDDTASINIICYGAATYPNSNRRGPQLAIGPEWREISNSVTAPNDITSLGTNLRQIGNRGFAARYLSVFTETTKNYANGTGTCTAEVLIRLWSMLTSVNPTVELWTRQSNFFVNRATLVEPPFEDKWYQMSQDVVLVTPPITAVLIDLEGFNLLLSGVNAAATVTYAEYGPFTWNREVVVVPVTLDMNGAGMGTAAWTVAHLESPYRFRSAIPAQYLDDEHGVAWNSNSGYRGPGCVNRIQGPRPARILYVCVNQIPTLTDYISVGAVNVLAWAAAVAINLQLDAWTEASVHQAIMHWQRFYGSEEDLDVALSWLINTTTFASPAGWARGDVGHEYYNSTKNAYVPYYPHWVQDHSHNSGIYLHATLPFCTALASGTEQRQTLAPIIIPGLLPLMAVARASKMAIPSTPMHSPVFVSSFELAGFQRRIGSLMASYMDIKCALLGISLYSMFLGGFANETGALSAMTQDKLNDEFEVLYQEIFGLNFPPIQLRRLIWGITRAEEGTYGSVKRDPLSRISFRSVGYPSQLYYSYTNNALTSFPGVEQWCAGRAEVGWLVQGVDPDVDLQEFIKRNDKYWCYLTLSLTSYLISATGTENTSANCWIPHWITTGYRALEGPAGGTTTLGAATPHPIAHVHPIEDINAGEVYTLFFRSKTDQISGNLTSHPCLGQFPTMETFLNSNQVVGAYIHDKRMGVRF
jgi:hypothetical protein